MSFFYFLQAAHSNATRTSSKPRRRMTTEEITELKKKSKSRACDDLCNWKGDSECQRKPKTSKSTRSNSPQVPMVDDRAPQSSMRLKELHVPADCILPTWNGTLDPIQEVRKGLSCNRKEAHLWLCDALNYLRRRYINQHRHLIVDGSSQWLIGQNVTTKSNIMKADGDYLSFLSGDGTFDIVKLTAHDMKSYLYKEMFYHVDYKSINNPKITSLWANAVSQTRELSWPERKQIIEKSALACIWKF